MYLCAPKEDFMTTCLPKLSRCWLLLIFCFTTFSLAAQSGNAKKPKPNHQAECEGNCFSTQVVSAVINADCCTDYVLRVSSDGTCRYDLSHFSVALPCGTVQKLTNSRNWKTSVGKDPTTGLNGFKIDDVPTFGKDGDLSFTVNVTICSDSSCLEKISVVAYKAGQCVDYDTLNYQVTGVCDNDGGGDDGGGDDGGGDDGGGDDGGGDDGGGDDGGGDNGGDSTQTCSTLAASMKVTNVTCFGSTDGKLEVNVQDGNDPFTYRWSTGETGSSIQNLAAGIYSVTIADSAGNILTLNKEVTQPSKVTLSEIIFNPSCAGSGNGSINISPSGGSGAYTFAWSNGATTEDIANLNAGTFKVTVTDSSGCSVSASYLLQNNVRILQSGVITKASCGQTNGGVNVTVSGGATPYTYSWDNGSTAEDLTSVGPGTYRLTITDANGCTGQAAYVVTENNPVKITFNVTPAGCFNEASGAIDITPSGGTAPYTFSWQNGATTEDLSGLVGGIYRVTVTDNAGCSLLTPINVPKKSIQVNTQVIQPLCNGDSTGSIVITPLDNSTTYTYVWSNGGSTNSISNAPVGNYSVTITDATGCSRTLSFTITQPAALAPTTVVNNNQCGTEGSFSIDLSVTGGKTPYAYLWSNGAITQDLQNLNSGNYSVTITDANGCSVTKAVSINPSTDVVACTITPPTTPLICSSVGNVISSAVTDAQSYQWTVTSSDSSWNISSGSTSANAVFSVGTPGSTATFSLSIQKGGCTKTCSYVVSNSCVVRDNNGGGDPSSGDPCSAPDSTVIVSAAVNAPQEGQAPEEQPAEGSPESRISTYPNPFINDVKFEWTAEEDDIIRLEVYDQMGRLLTRVYTGRVKKGETYTFDWTGAGLKERMYFYKYSSSTKSVRGKLFRK